MKKLKIVLLLVIVFILNIIWEFSHYQFYIDLTGIPPTTHLIIASLTDVFLIGLIFMLISLINKSPKWIDKPGLKDYTFIIIFSLIISTIIELYSVSRGRWAYTSAMPTIFGIGLSPLIQLFTTGIVSLSLLKLINRTNI
ncbi:hypothetical protein J4225_03135 [Candidatus Pacearchaeota archaeon]|nr:hypothetical protein [uncultured archaeon]MBS3085654.1 hypothetical protein [Candidatus Pacearchaeota archaeon]